MSLIWWGPVVSLRQADWDAVWQFHVVVAALFRLLIATRWCFARSFFFPLSKLKSKRWIYWSINEFVSLQLFIVRGVCGTFGNATTAPSTIYSIWSTFPQKSQTLKMMRTFRIRQTRLDNRPVNESAPSMQPAILRLPWTTYLLHTSPTARVPPHCYCCHPEWFNMACIIVMSSSSPNSKSIHDENGSCNGL